MTFPQRLPTTFLILVTTIGATVVFLVAGGSGSLDLVLVRAIYLGMAAAVLIPWLLGAVVRPSWRPSSRLGAALAAVLVAFLVSSLTSRFPRLSFEMLAYAVLLVLVYLLLVALMRRPPLRRHFQGLAVVVGIVVAALFLLDTVRAWIDWWGLVGHLAIPPLRPGYLGLYGPNPVASVVLVLGAFGIAATVDSGRVGRLVAVAVGALAVLATLISASRGAWLGAALGAVAVVLAAVARRPNRARAWAVLRSRVGTVVVIAAVPILAAAGILAALSGRLSLDDGGLRAGFARASVQMFDASPLTGVGPGTWAPLRASNTIASDPDLYIPHAHSIYFQTLAEFGLLGVVAAVIVVAVLGRLLVEAVRSDDPARRRVGYASLFGLVLLAGQQYADMLMNVPAVLLALAIPVAWLDATSLPGLEEPEVSTPPGRWTRGAARALPLGALVVTCLILVGLARVESVAGVANDGVVAANHGDWAEATRLTEQAATQDPGVNLYQFQLGVSAANGGDLARAATSLAVSASTDDYRYAWLDLAAVRWKLGDTPGARAALVRAERLGLQRTNLAMAAGWLRQQLGDDAEATTDYAIAISELPTLADDPFWTSPAGPPGGLAPILTVVRERVSQATMVQVDLITGQFDAAAMDIEALQASDPRLYSLLLPAWSGDATAWSDLRSLAAGRPLDAGPASWCRLIASHLGDVEAAHRYGAWLGVIGSPDFASPVIGRVEFHGAEALPPSFLDGYGSLYRRLVPDAQVVDLLPQVVLRDRP